jgi:hypothetical protein
MGTSADIFIAVQGHAGRHPGVRDVRGRSARPWQMSRSTFSSLHGEQAAGSKKEGALSGE